MPSRYFDRKSREIDSKEWNRLIRDKAYCIVRQRMRSDGSWVVASWLGLWSDFEDRHGLFHVEHTRWVKNNCGGEHKEDIRWGWCETEMAAIATAKRWERQ